MHEIEILPNAFRHLFHEIENIYLLLILEQFDIARTHFAFVPYWHYTQTHSGVALRKQTVLYLECKRSKSRHHIIWILIKTISAGA